MKWKGSYTTPVKAGCWMVVSVLLLALIALAGGRKQRCGTCRGTGRIKVRAANGRTRYDVCPDCGGTGYV